MAGIEGTGYHRIAAIKVWNSFLCDILDICFSVGLLLWNFCKLFFISEAISEKQVRNSNVNTWFKKAWYDMNFFVAIKPMKLIPMHAKICKKKKKVRVPHARTEPPWLDTCQHHPPTNYDVLLEILGYLRRQQICPVSMSYNISRHTQAID